MTHADDPIKAAEEKQSAEDFIATIAPMTATSGQVNVLRELGAITDQDNILEVWCGGGDLTAQLAAIGGKVVGADYSRKLIDAARQRFPNIEFVMSEADDLAFPSDVFDVVVSNFTAHHYSAPEKNFAEARRVLKAGGRFLVTMPVQSKRVGINIVIATARDLLDLPAKLITGGPLMDIESPQGIIDVMHVAGFKSTSGYLRTNYIVLESLDTLLTYAWTKIGLSTAPQAVQDHIRAVTFEKAQSYRGVDGAYRFPDQVLAACGIA
jgi:SAM-dependent methyltransferase